MASPLQVPLGLATFLIKIHSQLVLTWPAQHSPTPRIPVSLSLWPYRQSQLLT